MGDKTLSQNKNSPTDNIGNPQTVLPKPLGAWGLHPRVRSRAPASKTKIPRTIMPESLRGSGAPVGFINLGSLRDRLPRLGSTQEKNM